MSGSVDAVSARYAEALFALARDEGALDAVGRDVERIAEALRQPGVAEWWVDARVSDAEKRARLAELSKSFHVMSKSFLELLLEKGRERVLRNLGPAFRRLLLASRGEVEGRVESARPLAADEVTRLATHLSGLLGRKVLLENRVVPELIGGVRVLVAGRLLDQSVVGRLEGLRRRLSEARLSSPSV